jgi:hypothetical protein
VGLLLLLDGARTNVWGGAVTTIKGSGTGEGDSRQEESWLLGATEARRDEEEPPPPPMLPRVERLVYVDRWRIGLVRIGW